MESHKSHVPNHQPDDFLMIAAQTSPAWLAFVGAIAPLLIIKLALHK
jgi:hypothetical protein